MCVCVRACGRACVCVLTVSCLLGLKVESSVLSCVKVSPYDLCGCKATLNLKGLNVRKNHIGPTVCWGAFVRSFNVTLRPLRPKA